MRLPMQLFGFSIGNWNVSAVLGRTKIAIGVGCNWFVWTTFYLDVFNVSLTLSFERGYDGEFLRRVLTDLEKEKKV